MLLDGSVGETRANKNKTSPSRGVNADTVVREALLWMKIEHKQDTSSFEHNHLVVLVLSTNVGLEWNVRSVEI